MKGKTTFAVLFAIVLVSIPLFSHFTNDDEALFQEWKQKLGATFTPEEDIYRLKVFRDNLNKINAHNAKLGATHKQALNQFAFLTQEQFAAQYLSKFETPEISIIETVQEPNGATIDWVAYGAVSPVLNQGQCAATYAFSAIGGVQGLSVIFYQKQITYSVQQMVDCTQSYGNNGCASGTMQACYNYIRDKGVAESAGYPWTGYLGSCRTSGGFFKVGNYTSIRDCNSLANAMMSRPISVVVDGHNFQFYQSGIFYNCGTSLSLAAVLAKMDDYAWTLKNSWGTNWGENGYIRLGRGNTCGICNYASYPNTY